MNKIRIHVEAEPGKAAPDGIDAKYLDEWLRALIRAFNGSTEGKPFRIVEVKAGSIDSTIAAEREPIMTFWHDLDVAASAKKVADAKKPVRGLLDMLPADKDQKFELLDDSGRVVDTITAKARNRVSRTRAVPDDELATFPCFVDEITVDPRALKLYDLERDRVLRVACTAEQARNALALIDSIAADDFLVASVASSAGKADERSHRLLGLRTPEQQEARTKYLHERAQTFDVNAFLAANAAHLPKPPR